ncbi:unnamed protein product [Adineta steineri]|uniref:Uncharacterized protein n=1 Tax=Adineta steineri TaxID=433720 RepID=A0A814GKX0_9BILA|nr:unnamed protein product [Adineta steineri]CAF0997863.1 unnamed protein product [Adineta steineri]
MVKSKHDVITPIEQSFLSDSKFYIKNCNTLDSLLYPLAQSKVTSHESNSNDENDQQISQTEKLLIIRLLPPEHFINALSHYVIEQFDLNTTQINDYDFQDVNIITLPNIPVK